MKKNARIKDRVKGLRRVLAGDLVQNQKNWRTHPQEQRSAIAGVLKQIGYASALIARELPDGRLELLDGHLRAETTPDMEVPVLVVDLDDSESDLLLATLDPIAAMADTDRDKLDSLLQEVESNDQAVQELLTSLAGLDDSGDSPIKQLDEKPPPAMSWVLIGIPTVRYGEIQSDMERIGQIEGVVLESTVTNE